MVALPLAFLDLRTPQYFHSVALLVVLAPMYLPTGGMAYILGLDRSLIPLLVTLTNALLYSTIAMWFWKSRRFPWFYRIAAVCCVFLLLHLSVFLLDRFA